MDICKKASDVFEKFECYEYNQKRFEAECKLILSRIPSGECVPDRYLHKIDPHTYKSLSQDHPFRKIISRSYRA